MLLQKHAFSLEDLTFIARLLDSREHAIGVPSTEPSQNYDDTGYFSIEVRDFVVLSILQQMIYRLSK